MPARFQTYQNEMKLKEHGLPVQSTGIAVGFSHSLQPVVVTKASHFPRFAWASLEANPITANLFLPTLNKCLAAEKIGEPLQDQWWIILHSEEHVNFIVSCTDGYMGKYPLFFFTPLPYSQLQPDTITHPLSLVAQVLSNNVPKKRVYSAFGPEIVIQVFSGIWHGITKINVEPEPYYHGMISYLTKETIVERVTPRLITGAECEMRRGLPGELQAIAELCYLAAQVNIPFIMSMREAVLEASILLRNQEVYVYTVRYPGASNRIASIIATARNTDTTATITKIITHPDFRGQGCMEQLGKWVCKRLLAKSISHVVIYVRLGDRSCATVLRRIGFVGIEHNALPAAGVEPWLELGFDRNQVQLGHW